MKLIQKRCDDLISISRAKFCAYPYKDVPECWRRLYTDASIVKACSIILKCLWKDTDEDLTEDLSTQDDRNPKSQLSEKDMDVLVYTLDMAIIVAGAPGERRKSWIQMLIQSLQDSSPPVSVPDPSLLPNQIKKHYFSNDPDDTKDVFSTRSTFVPPVRKRTY